LNNKIIAVFTGNRAEYGLQFPILKAIDAHPDLEYRLIVSGAHLDDDFGSTLKEIKSDGFTIHAQVNIDMEDETSSSTANAIGSGIISMTKALTDIKPEMLVVYADRFEGFAAVIAGTQMSIPTAHIEGGDITEGGALDDSVRHAMTKLAHIHFTTNEQATNRLLGMGEEKWRVHTVGFPAIDMIQNGQVASSEKLQDLYDLNLDKPIVLFTQHSVTTEYDFAKNQIQPSLEAMKKLANDGVQVILTYPNNDAGGKAIIRELESFMIHKIENIQLHTSLGRFNYHGVLALARSSDIRIVCVGNSSSGIKETPAFGCPTVNIGSRQLNRLRAENVVDADYDVNDIYSAVNKCLFDDEYRKICANCVNPYGIGDAGKKIAEVLASLKLDNKVIRKGMTLRGECNEDGWCR